MGLTAFALNAGTEHDTVDIGMGCGHFPHKVWDHLHLGNVEGDSVSLVFPIALEKPVQIFLSPSGGNDEGAFCNQLVG